MCAPNVCNGDLTGTYDHWIFTFGTDENGRSQMLASTCLVLHTCHSYYFTVLREDINPPRFLLNRVPEQITETNV